MPDVLPRPPRRAAPVWLVLVAATHTALGLEEGLLDGGDYGLLFLAVPFILLTLGAAWLLERRTQWAHTTAVVLTGITVLLGALLVPVYLLGLFHLPQALLALVITARASEMPRRAWKDCQDLRGRVSNWLSDRY